MTPLRRVLFTGLLALLAGAGAHAATLQPTDDPAASPIWQKVRASLFESRPIAAAGPELLTLEAPARAVDAAVVPIAIRTQQYFKTCGLTAGRPLPAKA